MTRVHRARVSRSLARALLMFWACAACGSETTSFRPTDNADDPDRPGPPGAAYDVRLTDQPIAEVHVWSKGGYISVGEDPMTHIGFEIHNSSGSPISFDGEVLALTLFDSAAAALPGAQSVTVEPLSRARRPIRPDETITLGAYITISVRPRAVNTMQVLWGLRAGGQRYLQVTRFVRDDDYPVVPPDPVVTPVPVVTPDSVEALPAKS